MIRVTKNTRIPSVEETLGTLHMHNEMMPQFVDFDKIMMDLNYIQIQIEEVSKVLFKEIGKPPKIDASENMRNWLMLHVDTSVFDFGKRGLSLSEDSITNALDSKTLSEDAEMLIKTYQKYASLSRVRGTLVALLQNPISNVPSCDGHRMLIIRPKWAAQNTGRVAMRDPALQNLPHAIQEIQTVPEGYVLLHTDSGQIEPRIIYSAFVRDPQIQALINLYNDAYFGVLHYVSLSDAERFSGTLQFQKMEITDQLKASRQTIKTNNNAVMYGSESNVGGDPIKAQLIKLIGKHPSRMEWVEGLRAQIRRGETIFRTYFGTPIDTSNSAKLLDDNIRARSVEEERIRLAINNPIQGTAADLMRLSVYEANKLMMNKAKKSYIINYVHDAGTFGVHEDDYDKIADELGDIVHYEVEGWLPIYAEPEFGRNGGKNGLIEDLY